MSLMKYELGFYIPENAILHSHRSESLKSNKSPCVSGALGCLLLRRSSSKHLLNPILIWRCFYQAAMRGVRQLFRDLVITDFVLPEIKWRNPSTVYILCSIFIIASVLWNCDSEVRNLHCDL
jgi:hypothetical protein